jgi:hypothetical protein
MNHETNAERIVQSLAASIVGDASYDPALTECLHNVRACAVEALRRALPYELAPFAAAPELLEAAAELYESDLDAAIETYIPYPERVKYRTALIKLGQCCCKVKGGDGH